jgi:16S rRNA (guanine527-N7)-methyltransferase
MSVSRETEAKLRLYLDMLRDWQTRMNLVAPSTLDNAWERHIEDSLQLLDHLGDLSPKTWVDLGSGAGFPGIVVSTLRSDVSLHLIESRRKKCRFLEAVAEALDISDRVTVHPARIESLSGPKADVISARACASLSQLFDWGLRFQKPKTLWLLHKGRTAADEIAEARKHFTFDCEQKPSQTDSQASILLIRSVKRR